MQMHGTATLGSRKGLAATWEDPLRGEMIFRSDLLYEDVREGSKRGSTNLSEHECE